MNRGVRLLLVVVGVIAFVAAARLVIALLLFPITVLHTRDRAVIETRLKLKLVGVSDAEGHFAHAFRVWQCAVRLRLPRSKLDALLRSNGLADQVQAPWGPAEGVRKAYEGLVFGAKLEPGAGPWVAADFQPEGEHKRFSSSMVFGSRADHPDEILMYVSGCPRDTNIVVAPAPSVALDAGPFK